MTRHAIDDAAFEVPEGWSCATIVSAPLGPGESFASNIVVTRDRLRPGETLAAYADRQIGELTKNLKRFAVREKRDAALGGQPAFEVTCSWQGSQGPIEQLLVMTARGESVVSLTASTPKNRAERALPLFRSILASVSFNEKQLSDTDGGGSLDPSGV